MIRLFKLLIRDNEAASAMEYAMLVALIAAVIIGSVTLVGGGLNDRFTKVDSIIAGNDAGGGGCARQ